MTRIIGLISGTSVDGIDAALVDVLGSQTDLKVELVAGKTFPYPANLRSQILSVCSGEALSMAELAQLDDAIARQFASAALTIQAKYDTKAELIGSHGQTVYHRPPKTGEKYLQDGLMGYSLQLGRGSLIAELTGITTVSNFRSADIAAGGQGAPLVPIVDACLLAEPNHSLCIQNLGGIGNVAYLPPQENRENHNESEISALGDGILGWDTGPANSLLDLAVQHFSGGTLTIDVGGEWAASGTPCQALVADWLAQEFFRLPPPKSTGRELFGADYFDRCLVEASAYNLSPADVLATLTELTVASIVGSYQTFLPAMPDRVLLCGGGSHNLYLKRRLQSQLHPVQVLTTSEAGLSVDFKEAIAFAVLAAWRVRGIPGNLPQVTGARVPVLLGEINSCWHSWA
ncbi:anhydro-N-acetylmuramic acid kinase [Microcoleus sp. LEGE 07076]|uniref:anhydro-N-acetylmuramic acid kinase n=1 Tax=Microcoleus sp. LEGE 07076 TaxID=915322 RepID=UPI001882AF00|nr:anhydro-N-acetylmuramic acid kinase [Microcoleus sp. LEGE 07076]MBE9188007.1 anhydro-N-acetylmuramic acid kinase [Microcoleus sp. LEGE 07076]